MKCVALMPRRALLLLLLVFGAFLLQGCMVKREHTEMGPFYYHRPLPEGEGTESAVMWPFFQTTHTNRARQYAVRPIFNYRIAQTDTPLGNIEEIQALWPLFLYRTTEGPARSRIRFFPVFSRRHFVRMDGDEEMETTIMPFLLWGGSTKGGDYFSLFPLGGTLKGKFAKKEIFFLLFPLYFQSEDDDGEHRSWNILFPLIQWSKGGGKSSFRIFPLFGWKQRDNWFKKIFVLWPFFGRSQDWLCSDNATDSWFFLPFYVYRQLPFGKSQQFLWPFFGYLRSERPRNRFWELTAPWPFFKITRGDQYRQTQLWPLWGSADRKGDVFLWGTKNNPAYHKRDFILYPFYTFISIGGSNYKSTQLFFMPYYWDWHLMDLDGKEIRGQAKVWPLADKIYNDQGASRLRFLSPLWFRDARGLERNYGDFWTFYTRQVHPGGVLDQKVLWYRWYSRYQEGRQGAGPPRDEILEEKSPEGPVPQPMAQVLVSPGGEGAEKTAWIQGVIRPLRELGFIPESFW